MVQISFIRKKCIGCNACVEAAPYRWRVSKKDGRCNLISSKAKKGFHNATIDEDEFEANQLAARNCPVNIIKIKRV